VPGGWLRLEKRWGGLGGHLLCLVVGEPLAVAGVVVVGYIVVVVAIELVGWCKVAVACMTVALGAGFVAGHLVGWDSMCIEAVGVVEVADIFEYMKAAYMDLLVG
jgi:hypothetical protein